MRKATISFLKSIRRSKLSFIINLTSLATGLACIILLFFWVRDEMSVDKFHQNDSRISQVMLWYKAGNGTVKIIETLPGLLADALTEEIPAVEKAAAVLDALRANTLSSNANAFKARGIYAGKDFFKIFSFELVEGGDNEILNDVSNIAISDELAFKIYGTTKDITGRLIDFDKKEQFRISGVFKKTPSNSSLQFDYVLPLQVFERHANIEISWSEYMAYTFVLLEEKSNIDQLNNQILNWQESLGENTATGQLVGKRFSDIYLYGKGVKGVEDDGRINYVRIFSFIGIIILLIACINFISLSTAIATERMKEVGMKKVLGANRTALIIQLLAESILLAFCSLLFALLLVFLSLPFFNEIANKQLTIDLSPGTLLPLLLITILTGIVAGIYPAIYTSGFSPMMLLKGTSTDSLKGTRVRRILVVAQFTISLVLMIFTIVIYNQFSMIQNQNLGYNKDNILYFDMDGKVVDQRESFLAELREIPNVHQASSIYTLNTESSFFGSRGATGHLEWPGKPPEESVSMDYRQVDYGMMELLGMEMKDGRTFSKEFSSGPPDIIFNETAIELMNLQDPVGKSVRLWEDEYEIAGVVKDFYFQSINEGSVKPMFLILGAPHSTLNTIMVKVDGKKMSNTIKEIENFHRQFNPGFPFVYKFLDQDFQKLYASEMTLSVLSKFFAGMAILVSCFGLFGLTAFTVKKRKKELSIRKVLGSNARQIILLLYKDMSKLIIIALVIAVPISYILTSKWLQGYALRIELQAWFFIAAGGLMFLLMLLASGIHIIKALSIDPANTLRKE